MSTTVTFITDRHAVVAERVQAAPLDTAPTTGTAITVRREMACGDARDMGHGGVMVMAARSTVRKQRLQPAIPEVPVSER